MAAFVFLNGYVSLNASVLSTYVTSVEADFQAAEQGTTTMGSTWESAIGGLKSGSLKLKFNADVAAGLLDAIMWPLLSTVVAFEIRPDAGAVSTSNPKWTGSVLVKEWKPISGSVGDLATVDVTFPTTGTVTRATA